MTLQSLFSERSRLLLYTGPQAAEGFAPASVSPLKHAARIGACQQHSRSGGALTIGALCKCKRDGLQTLYSTRTTARSLTVHVRKVLLSSTFHCDSCFDRHPPWFAHGPIKRARYKHCQRGNRICAGCQLTSYAFCRWPATFPHR